MQLFNEDHQSVDESLQRHTSLQAHKSTVQYVAGFSSLRNPEHQKTRYKQFSNNAELGRLSSVQINILTLKQP